MDRIFPFLLENIIATQTDAQFFYRNSFEIDFVIQETMIIDMEKEGVVEEIEIIPAWKFLLN